MDIAKFTQSKSFTVTIIVITSLIVLLLVFGLGVSVGYHKARFSYQWGENYDRNFGGPQHGILGVFGGANFMNSHGISGSIIKIDGSVLVIKDAGDGNTERTTVLKDDTVIRRAQEVLKPSNLKVGDNIIIIGNPDDSGQIQVELLRVLPTPLPSMSNLPPPSGLHPY